MRRTAAVTALMFLLIACPGGRQREEETKNGPPKTSTTIANPQPPPPNSVVGGVASPVIDVQLMEFEIRMPDSVPAGRQTFHVANAGKATHNLAIEGNGLQARLAADLSRGNSADLTVDLKPGSYTVYCPVDHHRSRGMERTITVK